MTQETLHQDIQDAVAGLLEMARGATWNSISDNCKFIISEIKNSKDSFHIQRRLRKMENDQKTPVTFSEILPELKAIYADLYDINLEIYRADKELTIVDIRYYLKISLDKDYMEKVLIQPPMLHCKVPIPYWLDEKTEKFDINWEHKE